jgi:hypothetical protein
MPAVVSQAILKTTDAKKYVGGERLFQGLLKHHSSIMKPFSRASNNACTWRVATLDAAIAAAEAAGTFLEEVKFDPSSKLQKR